MTESLDLLVSNFVQQGLVTAPADLLYQRIKKAIPTATLEELSKSLTDDIAIRPLLLKEIKNRLNQAYYITRYSPSDNLLYVYVDHANNTGIGVTPTPDVLALSDTMAYICPKINDKGEKVNTVTKFTSLSHPELAKDVGECKAGNGFLCPIFLQNDTEDAEFYNLSILYNRLMNVPNSNPSPRLQL